MLKEVLFLKGKCVASKYFLRSGLRGAFGWQQPRASRDARSWAKPSWGPLTLTVAQGRQNC